MINAVRFLETGGLDEINPDLRGCLKSQDECLRFLSWKYFQ